MATVAELIVEVKASVAQAKRDLPELAKLIDQLQAEIENVNKTPIAPKVSDREAKKLVDQRLRLSLLTASTAEQIEILERALKDENAESERGIRLQTQLERTRQRQTREIERQAQAAERAARAAEKERRANAGGGDDRPLPRTFAGFTGQGLLDATGFAIGIGSIEEIGTALQALASDSFQLALSQERAEAALRATVPTAEAYAQAFDLAQRNQQLFGGTLADQLSTLQQFTFLANRTGADLEQLNKVAQLLAVVNPLQGFEGAGIAISELFSGDITSIVERFNLPRAAVRALAAEGVSAEERLQGLTDLLARQGVTSETLAASLDTTAQTYRELGVAFQEVQIAAGNAAAQGLEPAARGLTRLFGLITDNPEAIAQLRALFGDGQVTQGDVVAAQAETLANKLAQLIATSQALDAGVAPAYFRLVEQIITTTPEAANSVQLLIDQFENSARGVEDLSALTEALNGISGSIQIVNQATQFFNELTDQQRAGLGDLASGLEEVASASDEGARGAFDIATALIEQRITTEEAETALAFLRDAIISVDDANAGAAQSSFDDAVAKIEQAAAAERARQDQVRLQAVLDDTRPGENAESIAARLVLTLGIEADAARNTANAYLFLQQARSNGTGAVLGGIRNLKNTFREMANERASGGRPRTTGGRGGRGGKSEAQKEAERQAKERQRLEERTAERLIDIQERYQEDVLEAEEDFQRELLDIAEEFGQRRADAEKEFSDKQFSSRASFYQRVADLDASQRTGVIAAFESAQVEAAQIAATQGADVASEFLSEIQQIILDRAARQAEIAELLKDGQRDEAEFLRGVDAIATAEEERRLEDIRRGRGSIAKEEANALADAEQSRIDDLNKAESDLAEARAEANAEYLEGLGLENEALETQLRLLQEIANRGGGITLPAVASAAGSAAPTVPVPQSGVLLVRDDSAISATTDGLRRVADRVGLVEEAARQTRDAADRTANAIGNLGQRFGGTGG